MGDKDLIESAKELHQLGLLCVERRDFKAAAEFFARVADLEPDRADHWVNLGNALKDIGRYAPAVESYRRAIALAPEHILARLNIANALTLAARFDEAEKFYDQLLLIRLDRTIEAAARSGLGLCLAIKRSFDRSLAELNKSLRLVPGNAESLQHLAFLMFQQGSFSTAVRAADQAIAADPRTGAACNVRGMSLQKLGRINEAIDSFKDAVKLQPNHLGFLTNLAGLLRIAHQHYACIETVRKIFAIEPGHSGGRQILAGAYLDIGQVRESVAEFRYAIELAPMYPGPIDGRIFAEHFCPGLSASDLSNAQNLFDQRFGAVNYPTPLCRISDRSEQRPLRIGYISADFRNHVLALTMMPLFTYQDRDQFELWMYSDVAAPTFETDLIRARATRWQTTVSLTDEEVAELVAKDEIDIFVDLSMHMANNRLGVFARRPAPVQVTHMAYPGSTGLKSIDYRISDPRLDPPGLFEHYYSEKTIRLPDTFWCYAPLSEEPSVNSLPSDAKGHVVFGCFNNFCKVNAETLHIWSLVLKAVSGSRMMLLSPDGACRQWVYEQFAKGGIDATRIEHVSRVPRPQYLKLYHEVDITLDTLPYNGHTTSLDSLWMGVPVVSLVGTTIVGRAGLSQMTNLGLTDLVAYDVDRFVSVAADLAGSSERMNALRTSLRERMRASPLMDGPLYARNMEIAYRQMWQRWCGQNR